ncbi:MAG: CopG family transcriptional regulator [Acidimicrobiales bacterium]
MLGLCDGGADQVQLTDELVDLLDREAAHRQMSHSALIRESALTHLAQARVAWSAGPSPPATSASGP